MRVGFRGEKRNVKCGQDGRCREPKTLAAGELTEGGMS